MSRVVGFSSSLRCLGLAGLLSILLCLLAPAATPPLLTSVFAASNDTCDFCWTPTPSPVVPDYRNNTAEYIHAKYGSSSKVAEVRKAIPTWGHAVGIETAKDDPVEYAKSVGFRVAPGVALFVLTLLIWIVFAIITICCCNPDLKGYTKRQILVPQVIGLVLCAAIVAFSVVGYYATESFHSQVEGANGLANTARGMIADAETFFDRMLDSARRVSGNITQVGTDMATAIDGFPIIGADLPQFVSNLTQFGESIKTYETVTIEAVDPPPGAPTSMNFSCDVCAETGQQAVDVAQDINSQASDVFSQIDQTKSDAKEMIVDKTDEISDQVDSTLNDVADIVDISDDANPKIDNAEDYISDAESKRRPAVIGLFALPVLCVLFYILFTMVLRSEGCTKFLVHLMFLGSLLIYILFIIHLLLSVVIVDGCTYLDKAEQDVSAYASFSTEVTTTITACLADTNLLYALNVNDEINFVNNISFPEVPDPATLLNSSSIDQFTQTTNDLNFETFGYDPQDKYTALASLNSETTPDYFTLNNVSSCNASKYEPDTVKVNKVQGYRSAVLTNLAAETMINDTIAQAQGNMSSVNAYFSGLFAQTDELIEDFKDLGRLANPLFQSAQDMMDQAYCYPLNDAYLTLKTKFCNDLITSISAMAMASFFAGVLLFLLNVCCWFLMYRLKHRVEDIGNNGGEEDDGAGTGDSGERGSSEMGGVIVSPSHMNVEMAQPNQAQSYYTASQQVSPGVTYGSEADVAIGQSGYTSTDQ